MNLEQQLQFDNRFVNALPADPEPQNFRRQVKAAYSFVAPTPVNAPTLIAASTDVAVMLGLSPQELQTPEFAEIFTGNRLLSGMQPYAMCYGGHQFGQWAGQLGDGRAINLGEVSTAAHGHLTLQLKGAGKTPYSRTADGLAVLRSSIREFLCSEAMHYLGVPTTRALSLSLTGEQVLRDMFYDGHAALEFGAVVCRVSPSFMRFGSLQLPAARGDIALLRQLVDFSISADFPELLLSETDEKVRYIRWFAEVCQRTCRLMVHWQRVGFVHGVLNTDNMSLIGETIDYGPYGWLDDYNPDWTPNTTDAQYKRYRFGSQPEISQWNLFQLANAIYPLIQQAEPLQALLNQYADDYQQQWLVMMADKIGLQQPVTEQDRQLILVLEAMLTEVSTDMTLFYRRLATLTVAQPLTSAEQALAMFQCCYYETKQLIPAYGEQLLHWLQQYQRRLQQDNRSDSERRAAMNRVNPKYVLRNYLAQQAIELAEQGDFSRIIELQQLLKKPYDDQPDRQHFAEKRPDWAKTKPGCSMLSCSS